MLFGTQAKLRHSDDNLHVMIRNTVIDNVTQFKHLGVWLDPSLTWKVHINKLVTNVNKRLGVLRRVRSVLPQRTLNMLYKTMLLPHFDYCDTVWGSSSKLCLTKQDTLQNTAGKLILSLSRRFPTDILLSTLGWQTLSARRTYHITTLMYKSLTSKLHPQMCNIFIPAANGHSYNTRACSHGNLLPPEVKNESGKCKFPSRGVNLFNEFPSLIKYSLPSTLASFKCLYKRLRF